MFEESGHIDLLTKDAYQVIHNTYSELYKNGTAQHFLFQLDNES